MKFTNNLHFLTTGSERMKYEIYYCDYYYWMLEGSSLDGFYLLLTILVFVIK